MIASAPPSRPSGPSNRYPELLENGAHLSAAQFLHRYEASPEVKKAELVNGIVYMASLVRAEQHAEPDSLIQTWLGTYALATRGVKSATNCTTRLGPDDVPQPDALLRIIAEAGGRARVDAKGYLQGAPELVVEIASSTASLDAREKLASYRRAGVLEYLIWRVEDGALDWWVLEEDEYRPLGANAQTILHSRAFPGLWLDSAALLAGNSAQVMATLREGLANKEHAQFVAELKRRAQTV
jgi:Uma2 family endonuclease